LSEICETRSQLPDEEDQPFVIDYQIRIDKDDLMTGPSIGTEKFRFSISTKRLLSLAAEFSRIIQADSKKMSIENGEDYMMEDTKKFLNDTDYNNNKVQQKRKFAGLSKEEVLSFSDDPAWVKLRWVLFIVFWLVWFSLLGAVIAIVIITPKCPPRPNLDWWEKEIVYQVDVLKFKDSNGDGVGDFAGLVDKFEYLKELGVETLLLNQNVLKQGSPKQFSEIVQGELNLKEVKKTFKANDLHVVLDMPFSEVDSEGSVLSFWLTEFADGIRIIQTPVRIKLFLLFIN